MTAQADLVVLADAVAGCHDAATAAQPGEMSCKRGCDSCCHQHVSVSYVEAARVTAAVAALDEPARAALAATVRRAAGLRKPRCGALDDAGGCQLYEARPVACRSHGMVYRIRRRPESPGVRMRSCTLNYNGEPAAAEHVYDVSAWTERLEAIDLAFAEESGAGGEASVGRSLWLHELLARLLA